MSDSSVQTGIQLIRIIQPFIIIVGIVGNSFNIAVLTRRNLYYHSCSRYFLGIACIDLFYSGIILTNRLLSNGYQINLSNYSIISCKTVTYISTLSAFLPPYLIVFASIDRYCASSRNPHVRKFSHVSVAKCMMLMVFTIFALLFINILVMSDLQKDRGLSCAVRANSVYSQVYVITQVFLFAVVPPGLMMIFGLMTIQNSTQAHLIRVVTSRYYRTEHQLARMLLLQVSVHILLTLPSSVTYLLSTLPNNIQTTSTFSIVSIIFQLFFNCSYVTSFFLYLLSGHIYRKELIRLIHIVVKLQCGNYVRPSVNQNTVSPGIALPHPQAVT